MAVEAKSLNNDFIVELYKTCLTSPAVLEVVKKHLKYQYLNNDVQKKIWKTVCDNYDVTQKPPTLGILGQQFNKDKDALGLLSKIKNTTVTDNNEQILKKFEEFIKFSIFVNAYTESGELFNKGDKNSHDAIKKLYQGSEKSHTFTLVGDAHTTVFKDFDKRNDKRKAKDSNEFMQERIPFSIKEIDDDTRGGGKRGTSGLVLGRSGGGKSTWLKWTGASAARMGKIVVHFQAEGTEEENLDLYDSCWTSVDTDQMEVGNIPENLVDKIKQTRNNILQRGGEVILKSFEQFDSATIEECREFLFDVFKKYGRIDLVLWDYLEIFTVAGQYGNGDSSERKRREDIAKKITNIAMEFKCFCLAATQANDVLPVLYNDENFVMTRSHISEYKGCLKPFSYFFTINQTDAEYDMGQVRVYADKYRKHKARRIYKIWSSMQNARFYDQMRTQYELSRRMQQEAA